MKGLVGVVGVIIVSAAFLLFAFPSLAIDHKYIEDFTTTAYKDAANTTAWWDTAAGELKLFSFVAGSETGGSCDTPGLASGVVVSGNLAFVADGSSGLQVIDISDPMNPTLAGTCDTPGNANGVSVWGNYACVADGSSGLQVIDISNPWNPTLVGTYDTPGNANGVTLIGIGAYVADGTSGLQVIDISNPANPTLRVTCDTPGNADGVTVWDNYAYVADGASGLQVISVIKYVAIIVGSYNTPGSAAGATVSGSYAYVADNECGLQVINISNPANPTLAGTCDTPGSASGVTVSGSYAFVADGSSGLQAINIINPANPALEGTCNTPDNAKGITASGGFAYVADGSSGLQAIDISDPTNPTQLINNAEPVNPTHAGTCAFSGYAWGVAVSGDHAFVADGEYGLRVIDIGDPSNPILVGTCNTSGIARAVSVSGGHAYVADHTSGLQVIDISNPANPWLRGTCDTPGYAIAVAVSGGYAFVGDGGYGLHVINISNPANPTLVGTYAPASAWGVAVSGHYAYVADGDPGLRVINIINPASPTLAGTCNTPGSALGVAISGHYAFVADGGSGLQVIDISNPTNPTLVGTCDTPGLAYGVAVSGVRAFVADHSSGLHAIDISDPTNPTLAGTCDTPGSAYDVAVSGNYAYVADYNMDSWLQVIQVFQSEVDTDNNIGRSLAIDASSEMILRARLMATQTDSVAWELSANGGANWQGIAPNGSWNRMTIPGTDLLWRSTHTWAAPGVNPGVTQLEIDWFYEAASFDSIVDVPDDQGGWLLVHFARSGRDFSDEATLPISSYGIWRRVDSAVLIAALKTQASPATEKNAAGDTRELSDPPVVTYQGKTYVQSRPGFAASSFPPGTWERLATVPALQQDTYIASVPTAADSSESGPNHTVFVMTAHTTTPSIWYVSEPDSGYSVDNIAPAVPEGFAVAYNTGSGNQLSWDPSLAEDFQCFRIYRSSDPDFVPSPAELVHSLIGTSWSDPEYDSPGVYYKITALDHMGNESDPASSGTVTAVEEPTIPQVYGLYPNVPNPFNPSTSIRYDVPAGGGAVTLRIYDVSGRLIRTLVDGPQPAGQKTASWNGKDDRGRSMASGVYFCRLEAPGYKKTMKMVLVK